MNSAKKQAIERLNNIDKVETLLPVENGIIVELNFSPGLHKYRIRECLNEEIEVWYKEALVYNAQTYDDAIDFILA